MDEAEYPKLYHQNGDDLDDYDLFRAEEGGQLARIIVEQSDGRKYTVDFYNYDRLQQELQLRMESDRKDPRSYIALIILPVLTLESMIDAVKQLTAKGFFEHFKPVT